MGHPVDRSADRPDTGAKLSGPVDRSVGRPTVLPDVHSSVHAGRPQGRPALGTVDRAVGRPGLSATVLDQKNLVKNILINLIKLVKIPKNSFIILH